MLFKTIKIKKLYLKKNILKFHSQKNNQFKLDLNIIFKLNLNMCLNYCFIKIQSFDIFKVFNKFVMIIFN